MLGPVLSVGLHALRPNPSSQGPPWPARRIWPLPRRSPAFFDPSASPPTEGHANADVGFSAGPVTVQTLLVFLIPMYTWQRPAVSLIRDQNEPMGR